MNHNTSDKSKNSASNFFSEQLSQEERDLYDRQFRLEGWDQTILKNSKVLIVGVGGLGCEIAKNLAMVGVGHLYLVDLDLIEHSNLNRQLLFAGVDEGTPKAIAAAKKLKEINPLIEIEGFHSSLERLEPEIYKKVDLIISGLDSMNARLNLNTQAIRFKKPMCDGGVGGYHGHVYTIFPGENACFECYPLPTQESDEMAACTVVGIPRKRVHCVFKANMAFNEEHGEDPDPKNKDHVTYITNYANSLVEKYGFKPTYTMDEIVKIIDHHEPGIITINAVIASIQSHEAIKILHWLRGNNNLGIPMKTYLIFNGMTMKFYHIEKKRNKECYQCGTSSLREDIELSTSNTCMDIIEELKKRGYHLDEDLEPVLTVLDFSGVRELENEDSIESNKLRNYELITCSGFEEGIIQINLLIK